MPNWITVHHAADFWGASDEKIFPLPVVAAALGVSRNDMHKFPVKRLVIDKRGAYRKSDLIAFLDSAAGQILLAELTAKRKRKRKHENENEDVSEVAKREYFRMRWIAKLPRTIKKLEEELEFASWPADDETLRLLWEYRRARTQIADEYEGKPPIFSHGWWLVDDDIERDNAHRDHYVRILEESLEFELKALRSQHFDPKDYGPEYTVDDLRRGRVAYIAELRDDLAKVRRG